MIVAWDAVVRLQRHSALHPAGSEPDRRDHAQPTGRCFSASLLITLETTRRLSCSRSSAASGLPSCSSLSKAVEYSLYPIAVVLQVTPVIAIAPLLLIYMPQDVAVLTCAWLVAFFPILSNTMLGLQSVDRNLMELFRLYGAPASQSASARLEPG